MPETAPYDSIISTAAVNHIPSAWIEQLQPGGVIITDLRGGLTGALARLRKIDDDKVEGRCETYDAAFMPLRREVNFPLRDGADAPSADMFISADELVVTSSGGNWATASLVANADRTHTIHQAGPRYLWDSVEAAVTAWQKHGQPGVQAFGVTARTDLADQRVWLDDPHATLSWPLPI